MVLEASARSVRLWHRVRFLLLVVAALLVAHDATYLSHHGSGEGLSAAMHEGGHGYWAAFTVVAIASAAVLTLHVTARLAWLAARRGPAVGTRGRGASRLPSYRRELRGLWIRLLPAVALAFTVLENLEHLVVGGELIGTGALTGPEYPLAIPVLALVTLVLAAIGALVRWRIAILELHVARGMRPLRQARPIGAPPQPADWWIVAALCSYRWIGARQDPGRAPPSAVRA